MNCERTACASTPHDAREHLDPRHEKYDGPEIAIAALPMVARAAARALIRSGADVSAVVALVQVIHRERDTVALLRVEMERKLREASRVALDCAEHGKVIADLEAQVSRLDRLNQEADKARGRYAVFLLELEQSLAKIDPDRVTARKLRDALAGEVRRILRK